MTNLPQRRLDAVPLLPPSSRARRGLALGLGLLIALAGVAHAADTPKPAAPPTQTSGQTAPAPTTMTPLLITPAEALAEMADSLAKNGNVSVVTIEGKPITQADAADVVRAMPAALASLGIHVLYQRALDQLIRERLMVLDARKAGFDKDPNVLRRQGAATDRVLADAWLSHKVDALVTDQALHARYDRDIAGKPGPEEVRARVILVSTEAAARNLIEKIQSGADFADLARQFSGDASKVAGGDLDYVPLDALGPEVGSVMFALSPGQVTAYPVHAQPGYFIIRIEGRRQRATPGFDQARAGLVSELRREAAAQALAGLTADFKVKQPASK